MHSGASGPSETWNILKPMWIDPVIWVRRNQAAHRNLTDDQRSMDVHRLGGRDAEKVRREKATRAGADASLSCRNG